MTYVTAYFFIAAVVFVLVSVADTITDGDGVGLGGWLVAALFWPVFACFFVIDLAYGDD